MSNVVSFDAERVRRYLDDSLLGFMKDPPDDEYQRGFLAALVLIYSEALGTTNAVIEACDRMTGVRHE